MSGLAGVVDFRGDPGLRRDILQKMTTAMRHRGPDGEGMWLGRHAGIGYRKLFVTASEVGAQPHAIDTGEGQVALAYTGKIYNLNELRRQVESAGASVAAGTDVDVLLQGYLLFGRQLVEKLNGMFALAIWDGRNRTLVLARDRMGVQPLYYAECPGGLLFASEPKGIIAHPLFEARLDFAATSILLQPRLALPGETPMAGLREVPPAHLVVFSESGIALTRYWRLVSAPHHASFDETVRHVRELMEEVVNRQVTTNVPSGPIGAMLSGGLDSTSIAALAQRALQREGRGRSLETFCVEFESPSAHFVPSELRPDVDSPYAALAAKFIGSRHQTVEARISDVLAAIPETRRARDLPGWGQFDASMSILFRQMGRSCKVAVTGEAADELFGGYPQFFDPDVIRRERFPWLDDGPRLGDFLSPDLQALSRPRDDEHARYAKLIAEVPRLEGETQENARMREILYVSMAGRLAVLLDRMDRMSVAAGVEIRLPFCDHELVEYLWNVPWSMKSAGGMKGLLKAAMADIVPESTLNRKKSAYPHIQNREYDLSLIREALSLARDKSSPIGALFDGPRLADFIGQLGSDNAGLNASHILIQLVEINHWIKDYGISLR